LPRGISIVISTILALSTGQAALAEAAQPKWGVATRPGIQSNSNDGVVVMMIMMIIMISPTADLMAASLPGL
jgi:hypothetical protein